ATVGGELGAHPMQQISKIARAIPQACHSGGLNPRARGRQGRSWPGTVWVRVARLAAALLALAACEGGGEGAPETDAGPEEDGAAPPPFDLQAPALPDSTPCPEGFEPRMLGTGALVCEPRGQG